MKPILAGIETEYGFTIEDRSVSEQVDDATEFVRAFPGKAFVGWDYRFESPRSDLRGFVVEQLAYDPVDAEIDQGRVRPPISEERADRVLTTGARFYNDHGHPEYATPEMLSGYGLARADKVGEILVCQAARQLQARLGKRVRVYKNNTDYSGNSYGTHESYCVPRDVGFESLYRGVLPILVSRQVLTGAGKVGSETGGPVRFQLSVRADHLSESCNLETLFRRPVFNTRDEAHADPAKFIRMHVIAGDANLMEQATWRKVMLVKIAVALTEIGLAPSWNIPDPAKSMKLVSRDLQGEGRVELEGSNWTTPRHILESYLDAAECHLSSDLEIMECVRESRMLLDARHSNFDVFRRSVDWAAKYWILEQYREAEGASWHDPVMQSLDLAYHHLDPDEGLFAGLVEVGEVDDKGYEGLESSVGPGEEATRARVRGHLVERFSESIVNISWNRVTLKIDGQVQSFELSPEKIYPEEFFSVEELREAVLFLQD